MQRIGERALVRFATGDPDPDSLSLTHIHLSPSTAMAGGKKKDCPRCKVPKATHAPLQCRSTATAKLWPDYKVGVPFDASDVSDQDCKSSIRKTGEGSADMTYGDEALTQNMLEAMYQKVFGPPTTQTTAEPSSAAPGLPATQQVQRQASQGGPVDTAPPEWKLAFNFETGRSGEVKDVSPMKNYLFDAQGTDLPAGSRVGTNYVTVDAVPEKLYVYRIEYRAAKKPEAGGEAVANQPATAAGSLDLQTLTDALPTGAQASGRPAVQEGENDGPPRQVKRRGEKKLVFRGLQASHDPFNTRHKDWATDFDVLWSLRPLNGVMDTTLSIPNVEYRKTTGRQAVLASVDFIPLWNLDFPKDPNDAGGVTTKSLLKVIDNSEAQGTSVHITALNGLISNHATRRDEGVILVGSNKFFLSDSFQNLPAPSGNIAPLNAHRGYFSSVRPGSEKVLLHVGTKAGTFFNPMRVSKFLEAIAPDEYNEYGPREKLLIGRTVRVCYDRMRHDAAFDPNLDRNRQKTVVDIGEVPSAQKFVYRATRDDPGVEITVKDYFEHKLGATKNVLKDKYPCINVGMKASRLDDKKGKKPAAETGEQGRDTIVRELWIPAEYLELVPDQAFPKRLCAFDMENMLKFAQHRPSITRELITSEGLGLLGVSPKSAALAATLKISINPKLISVPARFLPAPGIVYRTGDVHSGSSWYLHSDRAGDVKFYRPIGMQVEGVHVLDFTASSGVHANIGDMMTTRLADHGIGFATGAASQYSRSSTSLASYGDAELVELIDKVRKDKPRTPLFLVLLRDNSSDNYAKIKRVFDQLLGLHTVCLTLPKVTPNAKSFIGLLSNLALKFNLKLGGQNHVVSAGTGSRTAALTDTFRPHQHVIILGADVSHAPSKMAHCPSVAAVVGNIDTDFATFPGSLRLQASGEEEIRELEGMVSERVVAYAKRNNHMPEHMVFYRDGVGEDQFDTASSREIERVRDGFRSAWGTMLKLKKQDPTRYQTLRLVGVPPPLDLTFIVVSKRHHTRFFPVKGDDDSSADERHNFNVMPGLMVDSVITRPEDKKKGTFDFYLQSHVALAGTAKSAHYIVLEPGKLGKGKIKEVTHYLCYNYARANEGVSYAAPAYYADRLADRGNHYLKAYTAGKTQPEQEWAEGTLKEYRTAVAQEVAASELWNPRVAANGVSSNPWHPNLDNVMFWL
ncbi:hypothetical protein LTR53_013730 [Teratosphaeriaceae sp. CCFEE 6253]|nr:hypothetical protein LTR53_013730 [Teratosphaeriaceae sp. CCFEE 6253]